MPCNDRLLKLLREKGISAETFPHRTAFTAHDVALASHIPGRRLAKVIVARDAAGAYLMAVIPSNEHLDLEALHRLTGRQGLRLATEAELVKLFPDCEPGAMPPVGHLYGIPMHLDPCLENEELYFQAGNHHEVVRLTFDDFERIAKPFAEGGCLHAAPAHVG
jgi:Ala-tRNA(Pro) deacylase